MPLVDTSTSAPYHANYTLDAARLWFNHTLGQPIPVGLPLIPIHYCRFEQQFVVANRARALAASLPIFDGESVLVVGAGFGWLQEKLAALLPASAIVSVDSGGWVQSAKDTDEGAEVSTWLEAENRARNPKGRSSLTDVEKAEWLARIVDGPRAKVPVEAEDLLTPQSRKRVTDLIGGGNVKFTHAITEHVLEWLEDAEAQALSDAMHKVADQVTHVVTPFIPSKASEAEPDPWNWKWLQATAPTTDLLAAQGWYTTTSWAGLLPADTLFSADRRA